MKTRQCYSLFILLLITIQISSNSIILSQTVVFLEDFETGTSNWVLTGSWGVSSNEYFSNSTSLTESPGTNYSNNLAITATLANDINLSSYLGAEISFWAKFDIEAAFDFMYLEISKNGGSSFVTIDEFTDVSPTWSFYSFNIGTFAGYSNVKFRFRFYSDQYVNGDGMYIDDISIKGFFVDDAAPLIVHNGPEYFEGVQEDVLVSANISDVSGISSSTLYYLVDGIGPFAVSGTNISGDQFNFSIPSQMAGSNISYKIKAVDSSIPANVTDTSMAPSYEYISGKYLSYDDGSIDAVTTITGNSAVAVKITIPEGKFGFLKSALIRNYRDVNHTNDSMLFHVWNDNNGLPGNDIITPFQVIPEATLDNPFPFTRIDLRGFLSQLDDLTGDFFIGFTVPQNSVSAIISNNSSGRSYNFDGTNWTAYSNDYEFRAIIYESSSPLPVELTSFSVSVKNSDVELLWKTASEVNNYGFEIERASTPLSMNSSRAEMREWEKVGFVEGHGNSNSPKHYTFEDNSNKQSGKYFYRLKQIDIDGGYEYSDVVEVLISAPNEFSVTQNYPNPFNPTTVIGYTIPYFSENPNLNSKVILKVYDVLGKEIKTLVEEVKAPGNYEVEFNSSHLANGIYFYQLKVGNFNQVKKMTFVK